MAQPTITMYRTRTCSYCHAAESFLRRRGLAFVSVDVTDDPEKRAWLESVTGGLTTVPQIFVGDRSVGGYTDLRALDASGELGLLLAGA